MKPKWIWRTWDRDGQCWEWPHRPTFSNDCGWCGYNLRWSWDESFFGKPRPKLNHKSGGPRAIRRIRIEKP